MEYSSVTSISILFTRTFDSISKMYMSIDNETLQIFISRGGSVSLSITLYFTIMRLYEGNTTSYDGICIFYVMIT